MFFPGILWPEEEDEVPPLARDLILKLLDPDPKTRLKASDMKSHPFFDGVNWGDLWNQTPPFVPSPVDTTDTSYFDGKISFFLFLFLFLFVFYQPL